MKRFFLLALSAGLLVKPVFSDSSLKEKAYAAGTLGAALCHHSNGLISMSEVLFLTRKNLNKKGYSTEIINNPKVKEAAEYIKNVSGDDCFNSPGYDPEFNANLMNILQPNVDFFRDKSYFNKDEKVVYCKEPLPQFTLNYYSNPNDNEVSNLCTCVWNNFPDTSWQKKEMLNGFNVMRKTKEDSWRAKSLQAGFSTMFGKAIKECGGNQL